MEIGNLLEKVYVVKPEQKYYFVRTDSGVNFNEFYNRGYIGIGWNYVTFSDLQKLTDQEIDEKIRKSLLDAKSENEEEELEEEELQSGKGKSKVTGIRNKLKKFRSLKKGDIIVIPSSGSSKLAFGLIDDDEIYTVTSKLLIKNCNYYKRRKVIWLKVENFANLDPIFYKIKTSRHSISNITLYGDHIDFVINSLYIKDDSGYLVFDIKTVDEINVSSLLGLIESIQTLTMELNIEFELGENVDNNTIRLNIQSPGRVAFKTGVKIAVFLGATLSIHSCSPSNVNLSVKDKNEIQNVINKNKTILDSLERSMDELRIDMEKMNAFK